jgi:hypothetical protein
VSIYYLFTSSIGAVDRTDQFERLKSELYQAREERRRDEMR